ncbi:MAG: hypothetical protein ACK4LQ_08335 [Pararhodobacter sp.]
MRLAVCSVAALLLGAQGILAPGAAGQVVEDCGWIANPAHIAEPWAEHARSYANGAIRVALLDAGGEPVCCAAHLLVLAPSSPAEGPIHRQCFVVSGAPGRGFHGIDIAGIVASYDPAQGLLLSVPVFHWHEGIGHGQSGIAERMELRIDQALGSVTVE